MSNVPVMSESDNQQLVQIEARKFNCQLERNNSGVLRNEHGTPVRYGLGNYSKQQNENLKSSDLIGGLEVVITPEMVGRKVLILTAFEIKEPTWNPNKKLDKRETAQLNYLNWVASRGGIASFIYKLDQVQAVFNSWLRG